MFELFIKGGPVMYLLALCSIIIVYIIIEKYIYLKQQYINPTIVINAIQNDLIRFGKQETLSLLKKHKKAIFRIAGESIKYTHLDRNSRQDYIKEASITEIEKLEKNISYLSAIITIAPILGLMGTVIGIMDIFNVISGGNIGNPELLSKGIAEALITTVTGLAITIPGVVFYHQFRHRIDMILLGIEQCTYNISLFIQNNTQIK